MCGINGIFGQGDKDTIRRMNKVLHHRGPDQEGFYIDDGIALGHKRLSIIDLSDKARQPMHYSGLYIVYNGEIYNFKELKKGLGSFESESDTEVILKLYHKYNEKCLDYLRGMFAFAIWDSNKNQLFIARDRLGKKPLFYYKDKNRFIFSSEIKGILANPDIKKTPDLRAINHYLSFLAIPGDQTAFEGIKRLDPGHFMVVTKDNITIKQYWDVNFIETNKSRDYYIKNVQNLLEESVKLRMISDVPLGGFLSGGIDSSAVVALMAKNSDDPVKTFTVKFPEVSYDESKYAQIIADKYATDHTIFEIETDAMNILPKLATIYDEPFADSSAIPSYYISREARKHVTVALNGDGGDESFVGYPKYLAEKASNMVSLIPKPFIRTISDLAKKMPESTSANSKSRMLKRFLSTTTMPANKRFFNWIQIFDDQMKKEIYTEDMNTINEDNKSQSVINKHMEKVQSNMFNKQLYTDIKLYLASDLLVKIDRASMANSLEARSPFLDHKLVEFSATIPFRIKTRGFNTKTLLKQSVKDLLPRTILKKRKQGFSIPIGSWFKNEHKSYSENILLSSRFQKRNLFRHKKVARLLEQHQTGKVDHGNRIYTLINLELWYRQFIDS